MSDLPRGCHAGCDGTPHAERTPDTPLLPKLSLLPPMPLNKGMKILHRNLSPVAHENHRRQRLFSVGLLCALPHKAVVHETQDADAVFNQRLDAQICVVGTVSRSVASGVVGKKTQRRLVPFPHFPLQRNEERNDERLLCAARRRASTARRRTAKQRL